MVKIQYTDKVNLNTNSEIPAENKVSAADMNEIKTSVNALYDTKLDADQVVNTQSNSQTDAYSCDYINGKIIDSSSADYIKFADGTCIVWGSYDTPITLSASSGDTIVCNLPITMKDTNYVATISKKDGGNGFSYIADTVGTRGTTSFNISLWNNGGANSTVSGYYWQVIGKWK